MPDISSKLTKYYKSSGPERCGLIVGTRVLETENVAEEPDVAFEIPAEALLKHELRLTGTWHTHPGLPSNLSHEDYAGFLAWPELSHFIIGEDGVREYRVNEQGLIIQCG